MSRRDPMMSPMTLAELDEIGAGAHARAIAKAFHVPATSLLAMCRLQPFTFARFALWRYLHEDLGWSYPLIGRRWGGTDHTTVMSGVAKARAMAAGPRAPRKCALTPDAGAKCA